MSFEVMPRFWVAQSDDFGHNRSSERTTSSVRMYEGPFARWCPPEEGDTVTGKRTTVRVVGRGPGPSAKE